MLAASHSPSPSPSAHPSRQPHLHVFLFLFPFVMRYCHPRHWHPLLSTTSSSTSLITFRFMSLHHQPLPFTSSFVINALISHHLLYSSVSSLTSLHLPPSHPTLSPITIAFPYFPPPSPPLTTLFIPLLSLLLFLQYLTLPHPSFPPLPTTLTVLFYPLLLLTLLPPHIPSPLY